MILGCPKCRTRFRIHDEKIKPGGVKVRCSRCANVFVAFPSDGEPDPADTAANTRRVDAASLIALALEAAADGASVADSPLDPNALQGPKTEANRVFPETQIDEAPRPSASSTARAPHRSEAPPPPPPPPPPPTMGSPSAVITRSPEAPSASSPIRGSRAATLGGRPPVDFPPMAPTGSREATLGGELSADASPLTAPTGSREATLGARLSPANASPLMAPTGSREATLGGLQGAVQPLTAPTESRAFTPPRTAPTESHEVPLGRSPLAFTPPPTSPIENHDVLGAAAPLSASSSRDAPGRYPSPSAPLPAAPPPPPREGPLPATAPTASHAVPSDLRSLASSAPGEERSGEDFSPISRPMTADAGSHAGFGSVGATPPRTDVDAAPIEPHSRSGDLWREPHTQLAEDMRETGEFSLEGSGSGATSGLFVDGVAPQGPPDFDDIQGMFSADHSDLFEQLDAAPSPQPLSATLAPVPSGASMSAESIDELAGPSLDLPAVALPSSTFLDPGGTRPSRDIEFRDALENDFFGAESVSIPPSGRSAGHSAGLQPAEEPWAPPAVAQASSEAQAPSAASSDDVGWMGMPAADVDEDDDGLLGQMGSPSPAALARVGLVAADDDGDDQTRVAGQAPRPRSEVETTSLRRSVPRWPTFLGLALGLSVSSLFIPGWAPSPLDGVAPWVADRLHPAARPRLSRALPEVRSVRAWAFPYSMEGRTVVVIRGEAVNTGTRPLSDVQATVLMLEEEREVGRASAPLGRLLAPRELAELIAPRADAANPEAAADGPPTLAGAKDKPLARGESPKLERVIGPGERQPFFVVIPEPGQGAVRERRFRVEFTGPDDD